MARITIEDCLSNISNRFQLVLVASHRARQLSKGAQATIPFDHDKPTVIALREVAAGNIGVSILEEENESLPPQEEEGSAPKIPPIVTPEWPDEL